MLGGGGTLECDLSFLSLECVNVSDMKSCLRTSVVIGPH